MSAVILRAGPVSLRLARRGLAGIGGLAVVLLVAVVLGAAFGEVRLEPGRLLAGLLGQDRAAEFVLWRVRLPRVATAAGAGAALGLAGAVFQSILRNPLASPDVIGFSAGAAFGVVLAAATGLFGATMGAAAGGLVATAIALGLAWRQGAGIDPLRVVLIGIGLSLTFVAALELLMTRLPLTEASQALRWLAGSFASRTWAHAGQVGLVLLIAGGALVLAAPRLRLLELGDAAAVALGARVTGARLVLALIATALAGAAVSVAGPVPFVALMSAPLARRLAGQEGAALTGAALVGATLAVLADLAGRAAFGDLQLPAGVLTGLVGAPFLLWLLSREMRGGQI